MTTTDTRPMDQMLFDIFVTALEGGITTMWASCDEYHIWKGDEYDVDGFYAVIIVPVDELPEYVAVEYETVTLPSVWNATPTDYAKFRIDRKVMARGYRLATKEQGIRWQCGNGRPPVVVTDDTDWDHDAIDADCIVQLALFSEVAYG